jgi:hypothetical protein
MRFYLSKSDITSNHKCYCHHGSCEENEKYFIKPAQPGWRAQIKPNVIIGVIECGSITSIYCRDCIDKVYLEFNLVFNSKLWPFR